MTQRVEAPGLWRTLVGLWRLARPAIWMVSLLPYALGHLLAMRDLLPGDARFLLGALVIGPLLWAVALLLNDACDLDGDRNNPRRATSPMVRGSTHVPQRRRHTRWPRWR